MTLTLIGLNVALAGIMLYGLLWLLVSGIGFDRLAHHAEVEPLPSLDVNRIPA